MAEIGMHPAGDEARHEVVRLAALRDTPLSVDEVLAAVRDDASGGTAVFIGSVRDHDHDQPVAELGYSAHPSAVEELQALAARVGATYGARAVAAVHRTGDLVVGDLAVVVAVACAHRGEALEACRALIDELKATVPIWKHQRFADGTEEWVGVDC